MIVSSAATSATLIHTDSRPQTGCFYSCARLQVVTGVIVALVHVTAHAAAPPAKKREAGITQLRRAAAGRGRWLQHGWCCNQQV